MKKVTIKDKIRKIMPYFLLLQFMLFLYLLFVYFNYQGILPMFFKNETEPTTTTPYTTPYYSYNTTTTSTTSLNNTRGSNPLLILKENEGDTVSYGDDTSNEVSGPYEDLEEVTDPIKDLMPTTSKQEEVSESGEVEEVTDSIKIPITMPTTETTKPTSAIFTEFNTTDMTSSTEKQENSLNALDVEFENTFTISQQNISNIVLN
jgi:hypothetical protein